MSAILRQIAALRDERRADHLWPTESAAEAVGCHPNKLSDWWYRTRRKLVELYIRHPGETSMELMSIITLGEQEKQEREAERSAPAKKAS